MSMVMVLTAMHLPCTYAHQEIKSAPTPARAPGSFTHVPERCSRPPRQRTRFPLSRRHPITFEAIEDVVARLYARQGAP